MSAELPEFNAPPVIETVIGVQFAPLKQYLNAHGGWFWRNYLDSDIWTHVNEVGALRERFEKFGEDREWEWRGQTPSIQLVEPSTPNRLQIFDRDEEYLLQIQRERFIHNWRKRNGGYPSYRSLRPKFENFLTKFESFAGELGESPLEYNQWELMYVNHLVRGDLWNTADDWFDIFPGLYAPAIDLEDQEFDSLKCEWQLVIGDNIGRLYVSMQHVKIKDTEMTDAIRLTLTARGPTKDPSLEAVLAGLDRGHEAIVRSFTEMTSSHAHEHWERVK